jgi:iron complex outermembrane receptor protein
MRGFGRDTTIRGDVMLTICRRRFGTFAICLITLFSTPAAFAQTLYDFNLPSQALADSLRAIGHQTSVNILFDPHSVEKLTAPAVHGQLSASQAVERILAGTNLAAEQTEGNTLLVEPKDKAGKAQAAATLNDPPDDSQKEAGKNSSRDFRVAQVDQGTAGPPAVAQDESDSKKKAAGLEEIVVTGTHIQGAGPAASPLQIYTKEDIDRTGAATVEQFMETLPQNTANTSINTVSTFNGGNQASNAVNGSGVNLHGVGSDSTLLLINGRRVAPGNIAGNFVDISMIPLSAVDRIEIVADGASAIYGSDAVGGVVNIIMRNDFDGSETRARYGSVTHGGRDETEASETLGTNWGSGSVLLSYDYLKQTPLDSSARTYTQTALTPFNLLPSQERQGVYFNAQQEAQPGTNLFADAMYSTKNLAYDFATSFEAQHVPEHIQAYSGTIGSRTDVSTSANLELSATYGKSETSQNIYNLPSATLADFYQPTTAFYSVDLNLAGTLLRLPAGPILYAFGGQYRHESYSDTQDVGTGTTYFTDSRNVLAEFVELRIPLIGADDIDSSRKILELTLADRNEHYSDFGSTNNPKAGLIWRPASGFAVRGSYGTSFKAPNLSDLNPTFLGIVPLPVADPLLSSQGPCNSTPAAPTNSCTNTLFLFGGNPNLEPEKARTLSLGSDWQPQSIPGLKANLTYYSIHYDERIVSPNGTGGVSNTSALLDASILGPSIIIRNPPSSLIENYVANPAYVNYFNIAPSTITALADFRTRNLSTLYTNGIDFGLSYRAKILLGEAETGLDGTKIFQFTDRFSPTAPTLSILNTTFNPIDLRLRAREVIKRGNFTVAIFANYTDSYTNNVVPPAHVSSWTTIDTSVTYQTAKGRGLLDDLAVTLGVTNLLDRNPPYVVSYEAVGLNYDGANANPLGRFVFLQLSKRL